MCSGVLGGIFDLRNAVLIETSLLSVRKDSGEREKYVKESHQEGTIEIQCQTHG